MTNHFRIQQASGKDLWNLYGFLRDTSEQAPWFPGESGLLRMLKEQLESPWHRNRLRLLNVPCPVLCSLVPS